MGSSARILLVEDNPGDAKLIRRHIPSPIVHEFLGDVELDHVETLTAGIEAAGDGEHDVVLLDLGLPETQGVDTLDRFTERRPGLPVVVLTGMTNHEAAVETIEQGAQDYLTKDDLEGHQLARSLRYAIERHAKERALRRQNERLEEFASVVAHDIRNPLNVATAHLEAAANECDTEHLAAVRSAHERMSELLEDVLMLAQQGATIDEVRQISLWTVAREAAANTELSDGEVRIDDDLQTVECDPERLAALFENLFRNALEHGAAADEDDPGRVTIRVAPLSDNRGFLVEDDGVGFSDDVRESLFESGVTTSSDGTGFGLAIVRRIVRAHGWRIDAGESSEGGARFEVVTRGPSEDRVGPTGD